MASRRRVPRSIVGAWGVQTADGPLSFKDGVPQLYGTKAEAMEGCALADMKPVRVTVRYPLPRVRRPTPSAGEQCPLCFKHGNHHPQCPRAATG